MLTTYMSSNIIAWLFDSSNTVREPLSIIVSIRLISIITTYHTRLLVISSPIIGPVVGRHVFLGICRHSRYLNSSEMPTRLAGRLITYITLNYISGYMNTRKADSMLSWTHVICLTQLVFRRLMGYHKFCSASGMFVENRIDNFDARIRWLVYGFYQRLMCSGNSLVNCVTNSSAWLSSDLYRNWN